MEKRGKEREKDFRVKIISAVLLVLIILVFLIGFNWNKISGRVVGESSAASNIDKISLSVATLKDKYKVKEKILLTDPPDENIISGNVVSDGVLGSSFNNQIINSYDNVVNSNQRIRKVIDRNGNIALENEEIKSKGYIIEFEDKPLVLKEKELAPAGVAEISSSAKIKLKTDINKERTKIRTKRETIKNDIKTKLEKSRIKSITGNAVANPEELGVLGEYENVFNGIALDITSEEAGKIKTIPGIKSVSPNLEVKTMLMDSVPLIGADKVWELDREGNNCVSSGKECLTGIGIKIAIIDTGIDYTHADLGGCFGQGCKVEGGYDFVNNDNNPMDDHGHGTHVAGIAAGDGAGGLRGVAPDAELYGYKVLSASGSGSFANVMAAIERAVDPNQDGDFSDHLDIISMSLGGNCRYYTKDCGPDDPMSKAVDNAVDAGVIAVIAAGNSGPGSGTITSPGTARKAITVGATNKSDVIASFSSRGPVEWIDSNEIEKYLVKPDIVAPGVNVCSAQWDSAWNDRKCLDDEHVAISGTSMATPMVAGAVALLKQKHPDWSLYKIKMILKQGADSYTDDNPYASSGRLNIYKSSGIDSLQLGTLNLTSDPSNVDVFVNNSETQQMIYLGKTPLLTDLTMGNKKITLKRWGYLDSIINIDIEENKTKDYKKTLQDDSKFLEGWPIKFKGKIKSPSVCTDFDEDGENEIIVYYGYRDNEGGHSFINVLESNGSIHYGFPVKIDGSESYSTPAIGDIDNDGNNEIIVATGNKITVINLDGSIKQGWPQSTSNLGKISYNSPVLADIDGDSDLEIFIGEDSGYSVLRRPCNTTQDCQNYQPGDWECLVNSCFYFFKTLYAFHHNGTNVNGWPIRKRGDTSGISVGDINNDGQIEIIAGSAGFHPDNLTTYLEAFNPDGSSLSGFPMPLFSVDTHEPNRWLITGVKPPVIAKIKDNESIIFVNPGSTPGTDNNGENLWNQKLFAFTSDGKNFDGWPSQMDLTRGYPDAPNGLISISDINNDARAEIIVGSFRTCIYIFNESGQFNKICIPLMDIMFRTLLFTIIDINNDCIQEILITYANKVYAYDINGKIIEGFPKIRENAEFNTEPVSCELSNKAALIVGDSINTISIYDLSLDNLKLNLQKDSWPLKLYDIHHLNNYKTDYEECNRICNINSDCRGPFDSTKFCKRNSSCFDRTSYACNKPGTADGKCIANVEQICNTCQYGCFKGNCLERPQSKLTNVNSKPVTGTLRMYLQKKDKKGEWVNVKKAIDRKITIPGKGLVKLDNGKDSNGKQRFKGWNNLNVLAKAKGDYRVYTVFAVGNKKITGSWEFEVV